MALALVYVFATAKPISMRRLSVLFLLALMLAITGLSILRVQNVRADALFIATSLTLLVWAIPLLRVWYDTMRCGSLRLDALQYASMGVRWSYAFVVAATPFAIFVNGAPRHLHLAGLAKVLVMIGILAFVLQLGLLMAFRQSTFDKERRPRMKVGPPVVALRRERNYVRD